MIDELRSRVISYLSQYRVCVIATSGLHGVWAVQALYDNLGFEIICRLPGWSDSVFHIEQDPHVMAIIQSPNPLRWLQVRGVACITDSTDDRYAEIRISPERIDLIDENLGWGTRETLEF